jgi:hypothetical protein
MKTNPTTEQICFPNAWRYRHPETDSSSLQETATPTRPFPYRERHLQCLWADPRYRPTTLCTSDGEPVEVEHPGDWNLEAGPDFKNAVLQVGSPPRRICGDLEIHIHPNGWKQHGHQHDPRYSNVRFHITYFEGPPIKGLLQIALHRPLASIPGFSFSHIDTTAYPYALPAGPHPLQTLHPDHKTGWLEAAGEERLRLKAERYSLALQTKEPEQLLYEELLSALGYKNNKAPFLQVATQLPLQRLTTKAHSPPEIYALLLGISGLLPSEAHTAWSDEARQFVRQIWDHWWRQKETLQSAPIPASHWNLSGLRPINHPARRIMAAAHLVHQWPHLLNALSTVPHTTKLLTELYDPFWSHHLSWKRPCKPTALLGQNRANAIITNITIPWLAATHRTQPFRNGLLLQLPAEPGNALIRQTAHALFGPDHPQSIYRSALARQGLIQVFHDYLLPRKLDDLQKLALPTG